MKGNKPKIKVEDTEKAVEAVMKNEKNLDKLLHCLH
jgi:hypothetical protein